MSIRPTLKAESVARKTRIEAANEVRAVPMVETNWPDHIKVKLRLRNTAKGEMRPVGTAALPMVIVILPPSVPAP